MSSAASASALDTPCQQHPQIQIQTPMQSQQQPHPQVSVQSQQQQQQHRLPHLLPQQPISSAINTGTVPIPPLYARPDLPLNMINIPPPPQQQQHQYALPMQQQHQYPSSMQQQHLQQQHHHHPMHQHQHMPYGMAMPPLNVNLNSFPQMLPHQVQMQMQPVQSIQPVQSVHQAPLMSSPNISGKQAKQQQAGQQVLPPVTHSQNASTNATHKLRRGPWSPEEDKQLLDLVAVFGGEKNLNWVKISQMLETRTAKQARERYHQNLKPSLNRTPITVEEGKLIEELVERYGKRWAEIARHLNGRSDNAIKNWWNGGTNRRKRLTEKSTATTATDTVAFSNNDNSIPTTNNSEIKAESADNSPPTSVSDDSRKRKAKDDVATKRRHSVASVGSINSTLSANSHTLPHQLPSASPYLSSLNGLASMTALQQPGSGSGSGSNNPNPNLLSPPSASTYESTASSPRIGSRSSRASSIGSSDLLNLSTSGDRETSTSSTSRRGSMWAIPTTFGHGRGSVGSINASATARRSSLTNNISAYRRDSLGRHSITSLTQYSISNNTGANATANNTTQQQGQLLQPANLPPLQMPDDQLRKDIFKKGFNLSNANVETIKGKTVVGPKGELKDDKEKDDEISGRGNGNGSGNDVKMSISSLVS